MVLVVLEDRGAQYSCVGVEVHSTPLSAHYLVSLLVRLNVLSTPCEESAPNIVAQATMISLGFSWPLLKFYP